MTREEESDKLEQVLLAHFGQRRWLIIYETIDGKSTISTSQQMSLSDLAAVLLASVVKLHEGGYEVRRSEARK